MWRYLWLSPLYLLIGSLPLLTTLGKNLEYGYSLMTAYLALTLIPVSALAFPQKFIPVRRREFSPPIAFECIWILFIGPAIVTLPGLYGFAAGLCKCSQNGFLFWMLVQVYPAWVVAHAAHYWLLRGRFAGFASVKLFFAWFGASAAVALVGALTLWLSPQKRLINLFLGFLHGPVYDSWIPVDAGIFLARLTHLLIALTALFFCWMRVRRQTVLLTGSLVIVTASVGLIAKSYPSVPNGKRHLDKLMTGELVHENIVLRYVTNDDYPDTPARIDRLFKDAQFHVSELSAQLGIENPKVYIYVYPNREDKKLWFGGGSTDVTDVVTPSIHITADQWPHPTLRHELVHALASEFGFFGLGFHPNMAFTEGLAVALAPSDRRMSLDAGSAALLHSNRLPNVESLFSPLFWQESGSRAYTVAGSIIAFIIEHYGIEAVKNLYSGHSWKAALGHSRDVVLSSWREKVETTYRQDSQDILAESLFRYPGTLHDLCVHSKADLRRSRSESHFTRLRQPLGWDEQDYWLWRSELEPDDRNVRVNLWRHEISRITRDRVVSEGRLLTWAEALANARYWPPKTYEDVELALLESDVRRLAEGKDSAERILKQLVDYSAEKDLGDHMIRQVHARLLIDESVGDAEALLWRRYLAGWRARLPETLSTSEPWIITYLRLRRSEPTLLNSETLVHLLEAPLSDQLPDAMSSEWYKLLGHHLILINESEQAITAFSRALSFSRDGQRAIFEKWIRKARFFAGFKTTSH